MERVKRLFSTRKPASLASSPQLKAQAYDAVSEREAPIMGSMAVAGNGLSLEQLHRVASKRNLLRTTRQSTEDAAAPPTIRRERRDSHGPRPSTAPSKGRTRSGFSTKMPPELSFYKSQRAANEPRTFNSTSIVVETSMSTMSSTRAPLPNLLDSSSSTQSHGRAGSSYIDLFDAVSTLSNRAPNVSRHKTVASGRRDYGEDVADRNIADFGSGDINLLSPQYSYLKNFYINVNREINSVGRSGSGSGSGSGSVRSGTRSGSLLTNQHYYDDRVSSLPGSQARIQPKTTSTPFLTVARSQELLRPETLQASFNSASTSSPPASVVNLSTLAQPRLPYSPFLPRTSSLTSTTSRDFHYPTKSVRSRLRSQAKSPPPAPSKAVNKAASLFRPTPPPKDAVAEAPRQEAIAPLTSRRASVASVKSYIPSSGRSEAYEEVNQHIREPSTISTLPRRKSGQDISVSPTRSLVDSPTISHFPVNHTRTASSVSSRSVATYAPTPPLPSIDLKRFQTRGIPPLLTPPMSPSAQPAPQASEVPSRLASNQAHGHSRSRGNSVTYSIFPPAPSALPLQRKRSSHASQGSNAAPFYSDTKEDAGLEVSNGAVRHETRKGMTIENSSKPISLDGIVDLTNTTDTDQSFAQAPAVIHEYVQPKVHHHTEERITREFHTHDVFHRILPVIDVEVLPAKHYIPDPKRPGSLCEIPESMVPARNTNWRISVNSQISAASSVIAPHHHRAHEKLLPVLSSKKSYITKDGIPKTEYVWRHPAILEPAAYEPGETMPVRMNCISDEDFALRAAAEDHSLYTSSIDGGSRRSAVSEEGLLFNDQGYGNSGMLPGLIEKTPMAAIGTPGAGKMTSTIGDGSAQSEVSRHKLRSSKEEERLREVERQVSMMLAEMHLDEPSVGSQKQV